MKLRSIVSFVLTYLIATPIVALAAWQGAPAATPPNSNALGPVWLQSAPASQQSGTFSINGDGTIGGNFKVNTTQTLLPGDIALSNDLYFTNSAKAIRIDGNGARVLNIGNYDAGTNDSLTLNIGGISIIDNDTSLGVDQLCINSDCRSAWPSSASSSGDLTDVIAGTGISVANPTGPAPTVSANFSSVQARLTGSCGSGSSIRAIDANGNVTCETDDAGDGLWTTSGSHISRASNVFISEIGVTPTFGTAWLRVETSPSTNPPIAIYGRSNNVPTGAIGVYGDALSGAQGIGVQGGGSKYGVYGSGKTAGGYFIASTASDNASSYGVSAIGRQYGVYATVANVSVPATTAYAGYFEGTSGAAGLYAKGSGNDAAKFENGYVKLENLHASGGICVSNVQSSCSTLEMGNNAVIADKFCLISGSATGSCIDQAAWNGKLTSTIGTCAAGSSIRAISTNGSVTCEPDDEGAASSGDITGVTAGAGLAGGGNTGGVTLSVGSGAITSAMIGDGLITAADIASNITLSTSGAFRVQNGAAPYLNIGVDGANYQLRPSGTGGTAKTVRIYNFVDAGSASDIRLKDVQGEYPYGLKEISALNPVYFNYKSSVPGRGSMDSETRHIGLIAQEVKKLIPEAVWTDEDGYYGVTREPINWAMINAVKELKTENDSLKSELSDLKTRLEKLEKAIQ
ncbi:MAG: hypothetical protein RL141_600 [Candidatus Parcubacteria bacterium]|jgi:hypothetical protein